MLNGLYVPGDSAVHRARPGVKLLLLLTGTTVLLLLADPVTVTVVGALVVAIGLGAGLGVRGLAAQVWPLRWIVLVLAVVQAVLGGPERAYVVVGGLVVAIAGAGVVTATTRTEAMTETIVGLLRHLERFGVDADRAGLLFALALRSIPVIGALVEETRQARIARGLHRSPRALLVPIVVRTVRHADRVGDALIARGVDD